VPNFTLANGLIRYKGNIYVGSTTDLERRLLDSFQNSVLEGHAGERVTYNKIKSLFYWHGMKNDTSEFIKCCPMHQLNKSENISYPGLLQPLPIPGMAFQHLTMDFIEALPKYEGNDTILVVVDKLTKYAHFIAIIHPFTTRTVVQLFIDNVFRLHGLPLVIINDRDRIFTNQLWQDLFKSIKVKLKFSSAFHPQTDGQSERVNQCLENYLRCLTFQSPRE
jgi:hypothetical protein